MSRTELKHYDYRCNICGITDVATRDSLPWMWSEYWKWVGPPDHFNGRMIELHVCSNCKPEENWIRK